VIPSGARGARSQEGGHPLRPAVFITGGTRGIGLGCARAFLDAGYDVAIAARDAERGQRVRQELEGLTHGRCLFLALDAGEERGIEQAIEQTVEALGGLDVLVNNAASFMPARAIDDIEPDVLREMLEVNVVGYFRACRAALPHLRVRRGSIVNIGSIAGANGLWREAPYCTSKAAIVGLTKALAIEEAANGVRVNLVLPGNIMVERRAEQEASSPKGEQMHAYQESLQWMGRSGTPEEVGKACVFLAGPEASFITGAELKLTGGLELGMGVKQPVTW
jgi:NAD(P)-dependent dehydrogenase (short-subunit alcohol dehydrogenase family)